MQILIGNTCKSEFFAAIDTNVYVCVCILCFEQYCYFYPVTITCVQPSIQFTEAMSMVCFLQQFFQNGYVPNWQIIGLLFQFFFMLKFIYFHFCCSFTINVNATTASLTHSRSSVVLRTPAVFQRPHPSIFQSSQRSHSSDLFLCPKCIIL